MPRDRDFDDEAAAHLDLATDEFVRQGLPVSKARRRARLEFGSTQAAKDAHREARGVPWLESLAFDARLALRGLRRDWTYALASVAMLALALALNTTVFTVMDAMLFRGYPGVPWSHELVFLQEHDRRGMCCISYADAARRSKELAVRLALARREVASLGSSCAAASRQHLVGLAAGILASLGGNRLLSAQLVDVPF